MEWWIYTEFFQRSVGRLFEFLASSRWQRQAAIVTKCELRPRDFHCAYVVLSYHLEADEKSWVVKDEIPYLSNTGAESFLGRFTAGRKIIVRVHPLYTTETRFFESEQPAAATRRD